MSCTCSGAKTGYELRNTIGRGGSVAASPGLIKSCRQVIGMPNSWSLDSHVIPYTNMQTFHLLHSKTIELSITVIFFSSQTCNG